MALHELKELAQVVGVGAGQRATLTIPVGNVSYDYIALELTSLTKAQVKNIKVDINGKTIQTFKDGTRLESISKYYGLQVDADRLIIPFYREHLQLAAEAQAFAIGCNDITIFQISWDIDGAAVNPAVAAYCQKVNGTPAAPQNLGFITKVKEISVATGAAGILEVDNIPRRAWIQAIHVVKTSGAGVVDHVEMEANSTLHWKGSATRMSKFVSRAKRTPQADWYHLEMMLKNVMGTQMVAEGLQDLRLRLNTTGAWQGDLVIEYYDGLDGI